MVHTARIRIIVSAVSFALLGSACDLGATANAASDDCQVTSDYKISCPTPSSELPIKVD